MKINKYLNDEHGQMLPYLAVSIVIMIMFAAYGLGQSVIYRDRMNIRDALDAAAAAALSAATKESKDTWYYEKVVEWKKVASSWDGKGNPTGWNWVPVKWGDRSKGRKGYISVDVKQAETAALAYFSRNMAYDEMEYKLIDWDFGLKFEQRPLQMVKDRPHLPDTYPYYGLSNKTWEGNFPRWVEATIKVRVETPIPLGRVAGKETVLSYLEASYRKGLKD